MNQPIKNPVLILIILFDWINPSVESTTSRPISRKAPTETRTIFREGNSPFVRLSIRINARRDKKIPKYMPVHLEHTGILKVPLLNDLSILWWHSPPLKKASISNKMLKTVYFNNS